MTRLALIRVLVVGGLLFAIGRSILADDSGRQYYGGWRKHPTAGYFYRAYYYKPEPTYVGYKHHYLLYFPDRPQHYYFYSPYEKVYWGRCPINTEGKPLFSTLAEADRKLKLEDIPESAYPKPGPL